MAHEEELLQFLLAEAGGKEKALLRFHRRQIAALASTGATLQQVLDTARKEGWGDWLEGLAITDLANLVNPPAGLGRPGTAPFAEKASSRLTGKRRDELHAKIFAFLKQSPRSAAADIGRALGWDPRKLAAHLFKLKKDGRLTSEGERRDMRYSLPAEEVKAVPPIRRKKA